ADTGNVWRAPFTGAPEVLSDFVAPNLTCLAQGPDGPQHVFAGGGAAWSFPAPTIVAGASGDADVVAVGPDRAPLAFARRGGGRQPPQLLGGDILHRVCVAADGAGRIDVFAVGFDKALYHKWYDGATWLPTTQPYEPLGGQFAASPAAVHVGGGQLHILLLGTDAALYHIWWDGSRWHPAAPPFPPGGGDRVGANCTGTPVVVRTAPGQFAVLCVSLADHSLQVKRWNGTAWVEGSGVFTPLGGPILGLPRVTSAG